MEKIYGIIPVGFFRNSSLSIFNGELLNGGAFRLRAVGSDIDGNPIRSKNYLFFANGMYSLVTWDQQVEEAVEYAYVFTEKRNGATKKYWEVKLATSKEEISKTQKRLRISNERPSDGVILSEVESRGGVNQYFYIA